MHICLYSILFSLHLKLLKILFLCSHSHCRIPHGKHITCRVQVSLQLESYKNTMYSREFILHFIRHALQILVKIHVTAMNLNYNNLLLYLDKFSCKYIVVPGSNPFSVIMTRCSFGLGLTITVPMYSAASWKFWSE